MVSTWAKATPAGLIDALIVLTVSSGLISRTLPSTTSHSPRDHQGAQMKGGGNRRWLDSDKRKLQQLKEGGYSDQAIATKLKGTPGAVLQQWRKQ